MAKRVNPSFHLCVEKQFETGTKLCFETLKLKIYILILGSFMVEQYICPMRHCHIYFDFKGIDIKDITPIVHPILM